MGAGRKGGISYNTVFPKEVLAGRELSRVKPSPKARLSWFSFSQKQLLHFYTNSLSKLKSASYEKLKSGLALFCRNGRL